MEKRVTLLSALLGVQLLLAAAVLGISAGGPPAAKPLLAIKEEEVNRITVEGPDKARVVLSRAENGWQLPDADNFPADSGKVKDILHRLAALHTGDPVATSPAARERFRVSDEAFERRITLAQDSHEVVLYLGTSPGLRRIHARVSDSDDILVVDLATHELPVTVQGWEDKALLAIPYDEIAGIEVGGLRLSRQAPDHDADNKSRTWTVEGGGDSRLRSDAADALARQLASLRFDAVLGRDEPDAYDLRQPALELKVTRSQRDPVEYRLAKAKSGDDYALKASTRPEYFRVAAYAATPLLEAARREVLLDSGEPKQEKPQAQQEGSTRHQQPTT